MFNGSKLKCFVLSIIIVSVSSHNIQDHEENTVKINEIEVSNWADTIGEKLWNIGTKVTKLDVIKDRYKEMNASVKPTDGNVILKTIVVRMNKLIKEKVDAVMRIKNATVKAESGFTSLNVPKKEFPYRNSKFSSVNTPDPELQIGTDYTNTKPKDLPFTDMTLSPDSHFENILVNTSYSSVHVPTNIFDRWDKVIEPIFWSEELDKVFIENYEKDPSLMWQYFASTSGFLRHFPAYRWSMYPDRYDCRKRIWYIQAATCSKEVIVLIDNSGTMYGMRNTIAQLTVDSLLQTFSNNDYVNIFRLEGDNVTCLVPCFNDTLMQATPENVEQFKRSLYEMCPHDKVNFTRGFLKAFHMLYNFMKNKPEQAERRNQAIFLLTDMLPSQNEMLNIRKEYEKIYHDTAIQVELFIYFIGKDIPEIRVVQWEKCLRNGSIVHVRTMDEVPEDVLKYLPVIARSQNENTEYYPISWTHVFLDIKKERGKQNNETEEDSENEHPEYGKLSEPRIMTSVTTPIYSGKTNRNSTPGKEDMIGVAAVDVPVAHFEKLTIPHKIGVNGYAFIVTNNGYLLFHPDLTPVKDGTFRENFNSVDLTEVEFYDDNENEPRKPNEKIVELRRRMVNQEVGNMPDMAIKFHYDDQKRVGSELRNYFFAPLQCSPFTLGLALPRGYGNYWIKTTDEIEISKIKEENYSNYFAGDWNVHPKWTYCDFRDREKYDYKNPKDKLLKFLEMIFHNSDFEWYDEHPGGEIDNLNFTDSFDTCFAKDTTQKPTTNYFCDRELMGLLFFDAKLTHKEFLEEISESEDLFLQTSRIRVKFVSTQSGLTRWRYFLKDEVTVDDFGEANNKALDEVWYKSAVLLHQLKSQNFVFSVPKNYGNSNEKYVTASHAIFYNDGENEAPGVVVGFQMAYKTIKELVEDNSKCGKTHIQNNGSFDCYMIDANGFVVYATKDEHVGRFFGEIEGAVMEQMISMNIFRKLSMFDYQAISNESKTTNESRINFSSRASTSFNLFNNINWVTKWIVSKVLWTFIEISFWPFVDSSSSCSGSEPAYRDISEEGGPSCRKSPKKYSDVCKTREVPPHIGKSDEDRSKSQKVPVDKQFSLYLYRNLDTNGYTMDENRLEENCSRPFYAYRVINTNLILVSVFPAVQSCYKNLNVSQHVIRYNSNYSDIPACNKKMINFYPRKKLRGCSNKMQENRTSTETCGSKRIFNFNVNFGVMSCFFGVLWYTKL